MCYYLNEEQQHIFNFNMRYLVKCLFTEKYDELMHDAFHIFLSVGAGVGKSFLVKSITEYLKKMLKHHDQRLDLPSILVTVSNGKADTYINGINLHSGCNLPVKQGFYCSLDLKYFIF